MPTTEITTVHQIVGKTFVGITPEGHRVVIDGEADHPAGMRPMRLLLNALGACAAFDIVEMVRKRRLDVSSYRIELSGERTDGIPARFTHIFARHVFDVPGLDQKTADRFVDLAMNKYCSVVGSLDVEVSFEVVLATPSEPGGPQAPGAPERPVG